MTRKFCIQIIAVLGLLALGLYGVIDSETMMSSLSGIYNDLMVGE